MKKHTYLWINPVVERMYDPSILADLMARHHCTPAHCQGDWIAVVRQKYRVLSDCTCGVIADARCPMAAQLVREVTATQPESHLHVADIEPILLHAARELAGRADLKDAPKLITTPCQALADQGNHLQLENTRFVAWNVLLQEWGEAPPTQKLMASPIPPGFFEGSGLTVRKFTGRETIAAYAASCRYSREQLVELLYCPDGCHNGDGVVFDETI